MEYSIVCSHYKCDEERVYCDIQVLEFKMKFAEYIIIVHSLKLIFCIAPGLQATTSQPCVSAFRKFLYMYMYIIVLQKII